MNSYPFTAMPQGNLPTAIDFITLSVSVSITEMSLDAPLVVNSSFSLASNPSCHCGYDRGA